MYDLCPEGPGVTVIIGHRVISVNVYYENIIYEIYLAFVKQN